MPLTPDTLPRHELNGLPVRVVESDDSSRVGLEGRVVVETTNTLRVELEDGSRVVQVPKSGTVFEFALTDDAAGDEKSLGTAFKLANTKPGVDESTSDRGGDDTATNVRARTSEHAAGENVAYVTVDGARLLSRPARRTETTGDSPWQ